MNRTPTDNRHPQGTGDRYAPPIRCGMINNPAVVRHPEVLGFRYTQSLHTMNVRQRDSNTPWGRSPISQGARGGFAHALDKPSRTQYGDFSTRP